MAEVAANWLEHHVRKNRLRTQAEIERIVAKYLLPPWCDRKFADIRRSDIRRLLDSVEDNHGATQARAVLSVFRSMANWQQDRDDDYTPPATKNMRRTKTSRERVLTDNELRAIWHASGDGDQSVLSFVCCCCPGSEKPK